MKKAVVNVQGVQKDLNGDDNSIELVAFGHIGKINEKIYITYKETELTGLEGTTTLLKIDKQSVTLIRTGSILQQKQEFSLGKKSFSEYTTPYGTMQLGAFTKKMFIEESDNGYHIFIEYELDIDGQAQSVNTLSILVREDK